MSKTIVKEQDVLMTLKEKRLALINKMRSKLAKTYLVRLEAMQ